MPNLGTLLLGSFIIIGFSACLSPIVYKISKNTSNFSFSNSNKSNVEKSDKNASEGSGENFSNGKLPLNPFIIFDFRSTISENPLLQTSIVVVFNEIKSKVDSITLAPLTYTNIDEVEAKIKGHNTDGVFIVSPLNNVIGSSKNGYTLAAMNYLIEFRKSYGSSDLKKCVISFNFTGFVTNENNKEETKHAFRQFLSF